MSARPPALTRRDRSVVAVLVVLLALIGGAIVAQGSGRAPDPGPVGGPPGSSVPGGRPASAPPAVARPLRSGVVGAVDTINPLLATSRVDQELSALVFSGLVRLGPGQSIVGDLAREWTMSEDGRTWTFTLRDGAAWHDGQPVRAADVVFTINLLRDPGWTGPGAASWDDVTATALDERRVRFDLAAPVGAFLLAATQPLLPSHLLEDVPLAQLAGHPFNRAPVGAGPYRLVSLDPERAVLEPAGGPSASPAATAPPTPDPGDPAATPPNPIGPAGVGAPLDIELRFYPDPEALAAAFEAGGLDTASGLTPADAMRLAGAPDANLLRYPTSRLTAVIFNLRPSRPEFRDPRARTALLRAIDRTSLLAEAWHGEASVADAPIPRVSWAFDGTAIPPVAYDPAAARKGLLDAGWKDDDDRLVAPGADKPFAFELLSPDVATNTPAFAAAASIAADWEAIGLTVTPRGLPPDELVAERLRTANFAAAVVDIDVGLDPDLYPLLGSTQGTSTGLNLSGLVDRDLDKLLEAARAPGTEPERKAAYRAVQVRLSEQRYVLPIAFRDELVVAREALVGPEPRQVGDVGDRFWDVLSWRLADGR